MSWYLRSLGDHDTHQGELRGDGTVLARCGAVFAPRPTWRVAGPPPGELVTGDLALRGNPPDPEQVCQECGRGSGIVSHHVTHSAETALVIRAVEPQRWERWL